MTAPPEFAPDVIEMLRSVGYTNTTEKEAVEAAMKALTLDHMHALILLTGEGDRVEVRDEVVDGHRAAALGGLRGAGPDLAVPPGTDRVFTSELGFRLNDGNIRRRVLGPAARAAGVPWATFHTFRHTCASLLFAAGCDAKQVSTWLGHADAGFTLRTYIHLMDDGVGDAAFLDEVTTPALRRVA